MPPASPRAACPCMAPSQCLARRPRPPTPKSSKQIVVAVGALAILALLGYCAVKCCVRCGVCGGLPTCRGRRARPRARDDDAGSGGEGGEAAGPRRRRRSSLADAGRMVAAKFKSHHAARKPRWAPANMFEEVDGDDGVGTDGDDDGGGPVMNQAVAAAVMAALGRTQPSFTIPASRPAGRGGVGCWGEGRDRGRSPFLNAHPPPTPPFPRSSRPAPPASSLHPADAAALMAALGQQPSAPPPAANSAGIDLAALVAALQQVPSPQAGGPARLPSATSVDAVELLRRLVPGRV